MSDSLLITGASGQLGRRVLRHLLDTLKVPARRLIATTRDPERLAELAERGVTVRAADFDDAASLPDAFGGAQRLLLISTDAFDRPGRRLAQHRQAIHAAEQAGVQHVVYTSMPNPEGSPILIADDHAGTERALSDSQLAGWTVLRNHWYLDMWLATMPQMLASGQWYTAAGDGRVSLITRDDLALAAATVLAGDYRSKQIFTLSGTQALTTAELAERVSRAVGRPLQVVQVPEDGLVQGMVAAGVPQPLAAVYASFDTNTAQGRVSQVTQDFLAITGRPPRGIDDWLTEHRTALSEPA